MNKLFVFDKENDSLYKDELNIAYDILRKTATQANIDLQELTVDYLLVEKIHVIISNGLPKEWFYILKGLGIVSIVFDSINEFHDLSDIVIDYCSTDNNKYFTGPQCSLVQNNSINIQEITDLIYKMKWDSDFFGFPIAYLSCRYLTQNIIKQADRFIEGNRIRLIEYLCNCHDDNSVKIAEQNNFHFTDIRISFKLKLPEQYEIINSAFDFRLAQNEDIENLKSLTTGMYKDSRYFYDGKFAIDKINKFYASWIEKAVKGSFDHECYCLFDKNKPIGFCSIRYNSQEQVSIGLFGVDKDYSGKGIGKMLLQKVANEMLVKGIKEITVVTQGRNYQAQRLYQSAGFRTLTTQLWYHKWI